jgi:hypothetical protein
LVYPGWIRFTPAGINFTDYNRNAAIFPEKTAASEIEFADSEGAARADCGRYPRQGWGNTKMGQYDEGRYGDGRFAVSLQDAGSVFETSRDPRKVNDDSV